MRQLWRRSASERRHSIPALMTLANLTSAGLSDSGPQR